MGMRMPMRTLAVCVATCGRPDSLRRLLEALSVCATPPDTALHVRVVDNEPSGSARAVVESASAHFVNGIAYAREAAPGVVQVRNRLIDMGPADLVAFIDDDEWPAPQWLTALVSAFDATDADVVVGPVYAALPDDAPRWLRDGHFLDSRVGRDVARAHWGTGGTGNVLYAGRWLYERGFRFNIAYGTTGAEDAELASRLHVAGARLVSVPAAIATEAVPSDRLRLGWLWRRKVRSGASLDRILAAMPGAHHGLAWMRDVVREGVLASWQIVAGMPQAVRGIGAPSMAGVLALAVVLGRVRARVRPAHVRAERAYASGIGSSSVR